MWEDEFPYVLAASKCIGIPLYKHVFPPPLIGPLCPCPVVVTVNSDLGLLFVPAAHIGSQPRASDARATLTDLITFIVVMDFFMPVIN